MLLDLKDTTKKFIQVFAEKNKLAKAETSSFDTATSIASEIAATEADDTHKIYDGERVCRYPNLFFDTRIFIVVLFHVNVGRHRNNFSASISASAVYEMWLFVLCSGADFLLCDACSERTLQQCSRQSEATGKCIERVTIVIDAAGWHIGLAGWTAALPALVARRIRR